MYSCRVREREHTHTKLLSREESLNFFTFFFSSSIVNRLKRRGRVKRKTNIIISRALLGPYIQKGNTHFA